MRLARVQQNYYGNATTRLIFVVDLVEE